MRQATHVGVLLDQLFKGLGLDARLQQARALVIWEDVVGPQIAAHTRADKLREDVLEVCVDQPVWMQQLQLMKPQILQKLNRELGEARLKDIFLKRGKVLIRQQSPQPTPLPWQKMTLSAAEQQNVRGVLAGIRDPDLRRELENFLSKQIRLAKTRADS